jgi:hypothetical protein
VLPVSASKRSGEPRTPEALDACPSEKRNQHFGEIGGCGQVAKSSNGPAQAILAFATTTTTLVHRRALISTSGPRNRTTSATSRD